MRILEIFERVDGFDIAEESDLVEFRVEEVILDKIRDIELDFAVRFGQGFATLEFLDFFFEHFEVERESGVARLAGLFDPEDVPGPTDLEITHRNLEPSTEFGMIDDREETFFGIVDETVFMIEEIAESFLVFSSDTTPELVELGETEPGSVIDENGVGIEEIHPVFYDGGRQEYVVFSRFEVDNHVLEFNPVHTTVGDTDSDFFPENTRKLFLDRINGGDPVVEEDHLTATSEFFFHGFFDCEFVPLRDDSRDGLLGWRRRCEDGDFFHSGEGEIEAPRDGRRGEGKDVDIGLESIDFLFVEDSESVFFVDDEESEIFECDSFSEDAMSPDDTVNCPIPKTPENLSNLS